MVSLVMPSLSTVPSDSSMIVVHQRPISDIQGDNLSITDVACNINGYNPYALASLGFIIGVHDEREFS